MRRLVPMLLMLLVFSLLATVPPTAAAAPRTIAYDEWRGAALADGRLQDVRVARDRVVLEAGADVGRWYSDWVAPGFDLTELIASWSATTPDGSWVEVAVRGQAPSSGRRSSWDVLARWTSAVDPDHRTSLGSQDDDLARVQVDTWVAPAGLAAWQLRVTLHRGGKASPKLDAVGAMASRLPQVSSVPTSKPGPARGIVLDVPRYSQMTHEGHSPQWGGGGEAWCSPTATSMVLGYYDALPSSRAYAWVPEDHTDPWVDHAARQTFDHRYDGTGNWPFNTAYAASMLGRAGSAHVTRLRSLREAEAYVVDGVPLVASIAFGAGELTGAPITSSNGHLLVIAGFTDSGDVVVNDPAAPTRRGVRRTYDRGEFEDAWIPASGGVVYVLRR